ncbi:sensor domain-containing protein [Amycolatopsis acidiphila]|uniref:histidine kinase n=1 Tax=Amycolatopsis acidiphila TaxID=715473 RepID=A0A558AJY9_9PSEU|nr:sensor domain-containing protein [Amycolatopsis acidiphila]TVT24587.1 sensor histidine kinase [Amycolatopsis acidiphila]UIJ58532.1 sensor domain-containing protein [Amycolatopsis acidiphila]GHG76969.1 histidine kinase [Amycolatopsis acidiphila]
MHSILARLAAAPLGREFRGELAWVLLSFPPTLVCVVVLVVVLALGFGLSPLGLGLLLVTGVLLALRKLGAVHRRFARVLLTANVAEPLPPRLRPGLWNWLKARVGDRVAWRTLGYLLVRLPLSLLGLGITVPLLMYGLGGFAYPLYWSGTDGRLVPLLDVQTPIWPMSLPIAVIGAALLLALPPVLHALTSLDRVLVFSLLGPTTLTERVRDLEQSRASALEDATTRLRRIERDLHDGAQAQLVALAMKLGMARDELEGGEADPVVLRKLVTAAHGDAKQALTELRDLARGIRPPALDAGLEVALTTLAARSAVDVRLRVELPERLSPATETLLYFSAAELLTNAVKHGGAPVVHVELAVARKSVRLTVSDEGAGGAWIAPGGGLAGVAERVGTVDGRLDIESPAGGPTVITAHIPTGG